MKAYPHPEWRRLRDAIQPLITEQDNFSYADLSKMLGIPLGPNGLPTPHWRDQFYKFQKYALEHLEVWFENDAKKGYRVTKPSEHPLCAVSRMKRGHRQIEKAHAIATGTSNEGASPAVVKAKRQLGASLGAILAATNQQRDTIRPFVKKVALASSGSQTLTSLQEKSDFV